MPFTSRSIPDGAAVRTVATFAIRGFPTLSQILCDIGSCRSALNVQHFKCDRRSCRLFQRFQAFVFCGYCGSIDSCDHMLSRDEHVAGLIAVTKQVTSDCARDIGH